MSSFAAAHWPHVSSAAEYLSTRVRCTPVLTSSSLDAFLCESSSPAPPCVHVFFKCESFQHTGSFKVRGALNSLRALLDASSSSSASGTASSSSQPPAGVTTHSSGNHASALAFAARQHALPCVIVAPSGPGTVPSKLDAARAYGAEVLLCENTMLARERECERVQLERGFAFVPPSNHWPTIYGAATAVVELLRDMNAASTDEHARQHARACAPDAPAVAPRRRIIVVPVGGGGIASGAALVAKGMPTAAGVGAAAAQDAPLVVLAEPTLADDTYRSFVTRTLRPVTGALAPTIADGLRTGLGDKTFACISELADAVVCVSEAQIVEATALLWQRLKVVVEPSSAVAFAAVMRMCASAGLRRHHAHDAALDESHPFPALPLRDADIGVVLTGGNVDAFKLARAL